MDFPHFAALWHSARCSLADRVFLDDHWLGDLDLGSVLERAILRTGAGVRLDDGARTSARASVDRDRSIGIQCRWMDRTRVVIPVASYSIGSDVDKYDDDTNVMVRPLCGYCVTHAPSPDQSRWVHRSNDRDHQHFAAGGTDPPDSVVRGSARAI